VIKAVKATNPDAFIAWSYPPDTFGLTEQAKIEDFNVKVYYNGIGVAFPGFAGRFGSAVENVLGFGGVPDNEKTRAFYKLHKEVTGVDADYNGSALIYACGQVLTQAFEAVESMDREAITAHLKSHTYQTMLGEWDLRNQLLTRVYTVGQWQGGFFHAVAGVNYPDSDYVPVKLKTSWA
jgi:branched-chain amino acid transport system substrate-binding protein